MTCEEARDQIDQVAMGDATLSSEVQTHLSGCSGCSEYQRVQQSLDPLLRLGQGGSADDIAVAGIMADVRATQDQDVFVRRSRILWAAAAAFVVMCAVWVLTVPPVESPEQVVISETLSDDSVDGLSVQSIDDLMAEQYLAEIEALSMDLASATAFIADRF